MTRSIIGHGCKNVVVVEKDKRFEPALTQIKDSIDEERRMELVFADILRIDEEDLFKTIDAPKSV